MKDIKEHFAEFRKNITGIDQEFEGPFGKKKIVYADWIASGRLYAPIEKKLAEEFGPYVGNTHTESSVTGTTMTKAYHYAHDYIKKNVNAGENDVIITQGSGMTGMINKFQRMMGLKVCEQLKDYFSIPADMKPVVFITHMEHHSNQTSWLETIADTVVIKPNSEGLIDYDNLEEEIVKYKDRPLKIGSFTACSNVTGIETDYYRLAKTMHQHGGFCFVDFAASAPYVDIDMHPEDPEKKLDAVLFSPHKFLGGPGTPGVLIFDKELYHNRVPDHPGGGTVDWTNPWGQHKFVNSIEEREDGGTPAFLQTIKAALAVKLKEEMNTGLIRKREEELVKFFFKKLRKVDNLHILADNVEERLGAISFYVDNIHYNLIVQFLNDKYGIQVRGGCSCAGTYGHYLLHVDRERSEKITEKITRGDLSEKPGWVRLSVHPTMTDEEAEYIAGAIKEIVDNIKEWEKDYSYSSKTNEFYYKGFKDELTDNISGWFELKNL